MSNENFRQIAKSLPRRATEPEPEPMPAEPVDDNRKPDDIRQVIYFPPGVFEQVREAEFTMRIRRQEIYRQAMNLWFREHGLPSWDEAKRRGERK